MKMGLLSRSLLQNPSLLEFFYQIHIQWSFNKKKFGVMKMGLLSRSLLQNPSLLEFFFIKYIFSDRNIDKCIVYVQPTTPISYFLFISFTYFSYAFIRSLL